MAISKSNTFVRSKDLLTVSPKGWDAVPHEGVLVLPQQSSSDGSCDIIQQTERFKRKTGNMRILNGFRLN